MLYPIQKRDRKQAAQILGQAFMDYPMFRYILPEATHRARKIHHLCNFLIRYGMAKGEIVAPSKNLEGLSIWIHSADTQSSLMDYLRAGVLTLCLKLDSKSFLRLAEVGSMKEEVRSRIVKGPHHILDVIGVEPQFQRQGYARIMIESKLAEFDQLKTPCYLETSDPKNLAFYDKLGFSLLHQYELMTIQVFCLFRNAR